MSGQHTSRSAQSMGSSVAPGCRTTGGWLKELVERNCGVRPICMCCMHGRCSACSVAPEHICSCCSSGWGNGPTSSFTSPQEYACAAPCPSVSEWGCWRGEQPGVGCCCTSACRNSPVTCPADRILTIKKHSVQNFTDRKGDDSDPVHTGRVRKMPHEQHCMGKCDRSATYRRRDQIRHAYPSIRRSAWRLSCSCPLHNLHQGALSLRCSSAAALLAISWQEEQNHHRTAAHPQTAIQTALAGGREHCARWRSRCLIQEDDGVWTAAASTYPLCPVGAAPS